MYCKYCGRIIDDDSKFCVNCGNNMNNDNGGTISEDAPSKGFAILGFFIPIIGLILYLAYERKQPQRAKSALHALCDMVGVSYLDTISVGDSDNDISITESAGLGIAVSNANELLKEVADEVICSNDEHIAAYLLAHYF